MSYLSEMSTSFCRSPEFQYWGDTDYPNTQQSALSSHDMAYDTWMRTINPSQLHTSTTASFCSTHTPMDPPSTPPALAIDLEAIPVDQWSSWLREIVQADDPSNDLDITLTETWIEHKPSSSRFDEFHSTESSAMDVDSAETDWPPETPVRQAFVPSTLTTPDTPSPFDGPMFPIPALATVVTPSPAAASRLSEPMLVTPTTPTSTPLIPPPNSFIPLAQRRGRRNVSAPTKAHVDLKAVLGESSDEEDITVASRAEPVPKAPARPRRSLPRPSADFDYTSSDASEDDHQPAKKPRVSSTSSVKSKGSSRRVYRRDPEKRRTQNEEAQRGYRQRRTAKYEAYQSGFEQLRQLYDMRSLNDRMKIRKVNDIIACVERVIEQNTPAGQRCTSC